MFHILVFLIHLYPLILIISCPGSLVSVIRAISMISYCRRVPRLSMFSLIPFILMAAMVSVLFFSYYAPFCWWVALGTLLFIS